MPEPASPLAGAPLVLVLLAPPLAHLALMLHWGMDLAGGLIAVQAVLVTWIASSSSNRRALRLAACGVVCLLVISLWRFTQDGPILASAVPHAMANLGLLAIFAASLRPGRQSVATTFAIRSRGHLPPDVLQYTRRVTWAWCWFFAVQLAGSLLLLTFAPLDVWSLFINVCNLPLIIVMLGAEYAWRQWRHPAQPPERLIDMVRIYRRIPATPIRDER
jgi:uncharacterized membrane protein